MKIYTRSGDKGQTSLFGGERVSKTHARVKTYGTLDELNSALGVCIANCRSADALSTNSSHETEIQWMLQVQKDLFAIGSWLASKEASEKVARGEEAFSGDRERKTHIDEKRVHQIELDIDSWQEKLTPMKSFILPGGSITGSQMHFARTICRRAEREIVELSESGELVPEIAIIYLNRLADALFVFARFLNLKTGAKEDPWV
jgi:cob(I)alamin adenosyltransferase